VFFVPCGQIQTSDDGLETPPPDAGILREVVSLLLLTKSAVADPPPDTHVALLTVFAGDVMAPTAQGQTTADVAPLSESPAAIAQTETLLWSLLNAQTSLQDTAAPPKADASLCLKYYRRVLATAKWTVNTPRRAGGLLMDFAGFKPAAKAEETAFEMEVDEYFSVVHLLSVLCRAIVLAYNAHEKEGKEGGEVPLGTLLRSLAPGTRSDIANALLAGLDHCAAAAKKRYDLFVPAVPTLTPTPGPAAVKRATDPVRLGKAAFLRQTLPGVPGLAAFEPIAERSQVETNIKQMFS
jgi:hypothetical protein